MNTKKRRPSRWKFIFIIENPAYEAEFFELNRLGKLPKGSPQPKKVTVNTNIKDLFTSHPYFSRRPQLSFSGNVEIFTTEGCAEDFLTIFNNSQPNEEEKDDQNDKMNDSLLNDEKIPDIFNNFGSEKFPNEDEIDFILQSPSII